MGSTKKNYKEIENLKQRGKLRYLERLAQEEEANREIGDYQPEQEEDYPENDESIQNPVR